MPLSRFVNIIIIAGLPSQCITLRSGRINKSMRLWNPEWRMRSRLLYRALDAMHSMHVKSDHVQGRLWL